MITEKQLQIFRTFAKKPFAEYMRKEIKELAKEKSNNSLAITINTLKQENVLFEKKIGKSGVLSLNLNNDLTFDYISLCNYKLPKLVNLSLNILKQELFELTPFYSLIIFGSYAENKQKENSDLDIAIFVENENDKKSMEASINTAKLKSLLELDVHIISKIEMLQMLKDKKENLGKQIARKHLSIYNNRIFYEIIKEGMKNGFRI